MQVLRHHKLKQWTIMTACVQREKNSSPLQATHAEHDL